MLQVIHNNFITHNTVEINTLVMHDQNFLKLRYEVINEVRRQ